MKLSSAGRAGLLAGVLLLSACGTADEPAAVSTAPATVTPAAPDETGGAGSAGSSAAGSVSPDADTADAPMSSTSAVELPPVPVSTSASVAPPTELPAAPSASAASPVPPTTFPDPEVVEELGHATNPLCEVLTVDEVAALLGTAVRPAVDDADGTGCLWVGVAAGSDFLQLQMLGDPARYARPADAETVGDIGDAAFATTSDGGWTAQAQNPDGTFAVRLAGAGATRDATVEGLRRLLERY